MFLAHFVGDVHQPLHVAFEEDEGGNTISVRWYKRKENLHHVCPALLFHKTSSAYIHTCVPEMKFCQMFRRGM
jgi:hypothetical protein